MNSEFATNEPLVRFRGAPATERGLRKIYAVSVFTNF